MSSTIKRPKTTEKAIYLSSGEKAYLFDLLLEANNRRETTLGRYANSPTIFANLRSEIKQIKNLIQKLEIDSEDQVEVIKKNSKKFKR